MTEFTNRPVIEVRDLRDLSMPQIRLLKRCSYGSTGWMSDFIDQILTGQAKYCPFPNYKLSYDRAHALIATDENFDLMGWAMVRHPSRRLAVPRYWVANQYHYGGRRPDFNVFVSHKHRQKGVAKDLLLVAYNNFGRVDAYPHDLASDSFYTKHRRFVTPHNTTKWQTEKFFSREVF